MSQVSVSRAVDELGRLLAQKSEIEKQEAVLKALLIDAGKPAVEGAFFRATVSRYSRFMLDVDAAKKKLSPQFLAKHTNEVPVVSVHVVARNNVNLREAA